VGKERHHALSHSEGHEDQVEVKGEGQGEGVAGPEGSDDSEVNGGSHKERKQVYAQNNKDNVRR